MKKEDYKDAPFSMEAFKEAFEKAFKVDERLPKNKRFDYYTPKEIHPGLWQIGPLWTGDGGKKLFEEAINRELLNTPL